MSTNFVDAGAKAAASYSVRAVLGGVEAAADAAAATWNQPYLRIPLQKPADGVTPDGQAYSYEVNDGSAADLDGDGRYEIVLKWEPTNAQGQLAVAATPARPCSTPTGSTARACGASTSASNIRAGAHYTHLSRSTTSTATAGPKS